MASLTWWTWVWVNSRSWWWTGRPGVLWFMGSQKVGHNWATELNWTDRKRTETYAYINTHRFQPDLTWSLLYINDSKSQNLQVSKSGRGTEYVDGEKIIKWNHPHLQLRCLLLSWTDIYWAPATSQILWMPWWYPWEYKSAQPSSVLPELISSCPPTCFYLHLRHCTWHGWHMSFPGKACVSSECRTWRGLSILSKILIWKFLIK